MYDILVRYSVLYDTNSNIRGRHFQQGGGNNFGRGGFRGRGCLNAMFTQIEGGRGRGQGTGYGG